MKGAARCILVALVLATLSGCASMFNVRRLSDDRLDEGFSSALLMRVQVLDRTRTMGKGTLPNMWFTVQKPGEAPIHEIPNGDAGSWEEHADGTFLDAPYTIEAREHPFQIEGGAFVGTGGMETRSTKLRFERPIAFTPKPGLLTHLGIIRIDVTAIDEAGTVRFGYSLVRDAAVEMRDLAAFRARFPGLASRLRTE